VREEVASRCATYGISAASLAFPHSLMIGFTARLASGELRPDGQEITEAAWFPAPTFPATGRDQHRARLIEAWRERSQER